MLRAPACASKGDTHGKMITITGTDAGSLHTTQFFIQVYLFYISSRTYIDLMP